MMDLYGQDKHAEMALEADGRSISERFTRWLCEGRLYDWSSRRQNARSTFSGPKKGMSGLVPGVLRSNYLVRRSRWITFCLPSL